MCSVDSSTGALTLAGAGTCEITATAAGSNDYNSGIASFTVTVQAAGALALNVSAIAGDNRINIAEHTAGFDIVGDTGTESDVDVTVVIGTETLTATSAEVAGTATWSVSVPASAPYITGTSLDVEVNASKTGYTAPAAVTRSLAVDLTAPTAPTYTAPASLKVGEAITPISPSGGVDINEYGATGLPSGLVLDTGTGAIGGTPDAADANTATATITASDAAGNTASVEISFPAVDKGDQALSGFGYSASSVTYGSAAPTVTAPTGVLTTLGYTATPASVCTVEPSTGALTLAGAGTCEITATAAGSNDYNSGIASFTVTVQAAGALALNVSAIAGDNRINIAEHTAGFDIGGDTGTESGVDVTVDIGGVTLTATSAEVAGTATWSVSVPASAPYITGTSLDVEVNASKTGYTAPAAITRSLAVDLTAPTAPTYTAPASLKVGEAITPISPSGGVDINEYGATGLPSGLVLDTGTGAIGGTPDTADASTATATITASDAAGNTASVEISFPAVDKGDQALSGFGYSASSVTYGSAAPTVTAPTGVLTTLGYTATPASVCSVDSSTGALTLAGAGTCEITATAAGSNDYNSGIASFTVTVQAAGALALNVSAIAGDNRINIAEHTAGFDIVGDTGTESGVDVTVVIGTETLTATSAEGSGTATWSVSVPASAPYITGTSLDVTVNAAKTGYTAPAAVTRSLAVDLAAPTAPSYTAPTSLKVGEAITAINPSGGVDIDEYGATGLPSGLVLDTGTGAIGGTPDTADASTATATVTASDAAGNTASVEISFPAVDKGDQALSGFGYSASSVTYGSAAPTVTAPTGVLTTLGYTATPASVCSVDSSTGALTLAGAGTCEVTVTAAGSNDYNSATASFTVTVQAAGALALNVSAIAGDNAINIAEHTAGFDIVGDTGTESGVDVTVVIGTETLTATSAEVAGTATWSVSVPASAPYITGTSLDVEVNASKTGYTPPAAVTRSLTVDLAAPTVPTYTAPASLKVGEAITAINPSGGVDINEYGATGLPSGLVLDTGTGAIGGTPDTADANTATATITASDAAGNTASVEISFPAVDKGDQVLSGFGYSASSVTYGSTAPTVTAPTGVLTTLGYTATPAEVCSVDSSTGALTLAGAGTCEITATAAGSNDYNSGIASFTVTVQAAGALALNVSAIAGDNRINIAEHTAGFDIVGDTGIESGVDVTVDIGGVTLTATSAEVAGTATWSVSVPASAPYITGTSLDVEVNASKTGYTAPAAITRSLAVDLTAPTAPTYTAPASLKVGEAITPISPSGGVDINEYGATGLPSGLVLDTGTGAIGGTPDTADASTATATITASDAAGNTASVEISFPAVDKGDQALSGFGYSASSVTYGSAAPTVTAPTGVLTTLGYTATPASVCSVDSSTGALTLAGAGTCEVTATAAGSNDYNEETATFTVTVQAAGALVLNVSAIAGDNAINIAEHTAGFDIGGDTGTESGVDVTVVIGTETLTATSAEVAGTATWSVSVPASAPYITGTSLDVEVNASKTGYTAPAAVTRSLTVDLAAPTVPSYTAPASLKVGEAITAINPSGGVDINEYGATGLPSGLVLDTGTGAIGGTPDTADANTATATITASDAAGNTASVEISFPAVDKGDQVLSGFGYSASSVTYGSTAPTVTAPTGVLTTLGYTATPASVCSVDSSTGALTLAGAGTCEITATAAGSNDYNSGIASFTVTVQAAGALALNVSAIAGDNAINIAEHTAGFDIGGDTGIESDVDVTVVIGTETLTATSAEVAGTATWSVSVPASAPYITGTSLDVEVNASKTGYTAPAAVTRSLTVDLAAPTVPSYTAPASLKVGEAITAINPSGGVDINEYGATGLPSGLVLDTGTGAIGGTPDTADASTATATITASDAAGNTASVEISFPAVDKGDQVLSGFGYSASSVTYGSTAPTVTAPTGVLTTLGYTATPASVCSVDSSTGALTLAGAGTCEITATAAGSNDYNSGIASFTVTVQAAGALALNVSAIAGDNAINIAEHTAGFDIVGDTGIESGVDVTVDIGGVTLTATSAEVAGTATWSVSVPASAPYITGTSLDVEVNASKTGYTAPAAITRSLAVDLTAPTAPTYTAPASLKVGEAITPISPSGGVDINEYGATGLPSGLVLDTGTGAIGGTPDAADANTATATVTASDAAGNTASVEISFPAVDKGDQVLSGFGYSASSVTYGSAAPTVTAPTGVLTTLGYTATPASVCSVEPSTGALTLAGAGTCEITATAAGSNDYNEETATFTVTVQAAGALVLNVSAIAGDNRINIAEHTAGFDIGGDTGIESGVDVTVVIGTETLTATSAEVAGTATWSVSVPADAAYIRGTSLDVEVNASKTGFSAPAAITRSLTVDLAAPTAPSYTAPVSLKVGEVIGAISPIGGAGIDGYGATGLPSGLVLDANSGAIGGTPDAADANTATATVTASDAAGNTASVEISFPAVDKGDQVLSGFQYSASSVTYGSAAPTVTAPTGVLTTLGYTATPASVCSVDSSTGALTLAGAGTCVINAEAAATDNYNSATASFTVTVQAAGALVLNVSAIAGDNRINIAERTAGFDIGGDTGTESGVDVTVVIGTETLSTTSAEVAGTATWSVSVPADAAYIRGTSLDVEVNASKTGFSAPAVITRSLTVDLTAPTAPSYTAPVSLKVGEVIGAISPIGGAGIDGYGATGLPSGLEIDTNSGAIGGTPDAADANTATATVTAHDTAGNTASVDISFPAVDKGDQVLSGFGYSASSVTYGSAAPTVTAPSGVLTTLGYSATPAEVCTVEPSTGVLTLVSAGTCVINAEAAATANYNSGIASFTVTVQAAGALVLNVSAIAGDNRINIAERTAGFDIGGDTGTESGVDVTVVIGTETLSTTSAEVAGTATWSVSVPADAAYIRGTSLDVEVNASKTGFSAPAVITRSLTVDLTAPTAPAYTAPTSLKVGEVISAINPGGAGIDGYRATGLPSGLEIDTNSGAISGTPDTANADPADARVTASDAAGNTATVDISFPAVAKGDQALSGFGYSASSVKFGSTVPSVTAPTGVRTSLSYSATPDSVCAVDPSTGALTLVGAGTCEVTATAKGSDDYNSAIATYTVTVEDDEPVSSGVTLSVTPDLIDEGASGTQILVTATLNGATRSDPTDVGVTVESGTATQGTDFSEVENFTITIPADSHSHTGSFTLTPTQDTVDEPDETVSVTGTAAELTVEGTSVEITDDDAPPTLSLSLSESAIGEDGGVATITATLNHASSVATTVTVSADPVPPAIASDYLLSENGVLTIAAESTTSSGTVTLTSVDNDVDAADKTVSVKGDADNSLGVTDPEDLSLTIVDDDERGVRVSATALDIDEGDDGTYTLVLTSQPTGEVTVTPSRGSGDTDVTVSAALTFTAANWDQAQTVTVSAVQDSDAADDTALIQHVISGADYGANSVMADDVSVTVDDADADAAMTLTLTVNPAAVDEDGGGTSVTVTGTLEDVTRDAPTTLTVRFGAADDAATEGSDYVAVNDLSLTIPSGQASGTASFTLTTIDDFIDEPDEALSITGTTQDDGFEVIGTKVSITDNDERGVTVSPSVLTLSEGAGATYTVVLESEPTQVVTVTPRVSGSPDLTFTPSSLTFTSSDWDTAQRMTVSATEDDDADHDSSIISHAAEGAEYTSLVDGELSVTIFDIDVAPQGELPGQVTDPTATATPTHVDLSWVAVQDAVLGYRVEASYDGGVNWAVVEDNTESVATAFRHHVGLSFAETRRYRVSAVGVNGAGVPSISLRASAMAWAGGLTTSVPTLAETTTDVPAIDLCWIPEGVPASELGNVAMTRIPFHSSSSVDMSDLIWQSVGGGSAEVDCEDGIGVRVTSINANQRYAFGMRANHADTWLISNPAQAVWVDSSKPLRTLVTAGASGLSGDTRVPELVCRDYDDPATREDEEGSFLVGIGFTTAPPEFLRYETVNDFDPASDLTLVNATAQLLDRPYDTLLGYRVRITPSVWGEPVAVSLAADVVTHVETSVGNQASQVFRRETADAEDCDSSSLELARRSRVVAARFEQDADHNGEWSTGEPIRVTLQFNERVRVDTAAGVPSVTLAIGEAATEVAAPFLRLAHEDSLVFEHLVTAQESPIRDIALLADSLTLNGGEIDSFSGPAVDLAHAEAAVVGGQFVRADLTARWSMVPTAHEGRETSFEMHLRFSEDVDLVEVIGEQNLLEHAFSVTGGAIEAIWPGRDRQGEFLANEWAMRVVPDSEEPVTISPVLDLACDQAGAICTIDDRPLSAAPSVTVHRTELGLSVADAEVGEGPGAMLVFEVALARAANQTVTVAYETADDTATAGEDYDAVSGTLRFEAGQTTGLVLVSIIDDSHDEGEETLTLTLSNATNAQIHDGEALGTIVNSDPIPSAWLARFGRAASDHVAQAVARRLERGRSEEHLKVGGLRLDRLFADLSDLDAGPGQSASTHEDLDSLAPDTMRPVAGAWAAAGSGSGHRQPAGGLGMGTFSSIPTSASDAQWLSDGMTALYGGGSGGGSGGSSRASDALPSLLDVLMGDSLSPPRLGDALAGSSFALPSLSDVLMGGSFALPSLRDVLMGSSFFYSYGDHEDASSGPWTAWGETASTRFRGSEGSLSLDGEVSTAMLGLDKRYGRWLVGSTLSHSMGEGGYQRSGTIGGTVQSTLTSLSPYVHYERSETTSLWGVFGFGSGSLRLTPEGAESALETDLSNLMAAFGGRGLLSVRSGDAGQFELALRSDALLTRTDSEAVQGLESAQGATSRVRLMLEGSGSMPLASGGMLTPRLEAGLRYDAGDAETGAGLEVGGGLGYAAGSLSFEVNARALVAHEDTDYEEWGFSGSLVYSPGRTGRGLSMKLGSAWGSTQSGVQSLWNRPDASGMARSAAFDAAQRYQVELGYGIVNQRMSALWVPFIAAQAADGGGQSLRMGVKLTSGAGIEAGLEFGRLENERDAPEHAVQIGGALRW